MRYRIQANIEQITNKGVRSIQIPTFELNVDIQGIVSARHAERIAADIINPTNDLSIRVYAFAQCIDWESE